MSTEDDTREILVDIEIDEVEAFIEGIVWKRIVYTLNNLLEGNAADVRESQEGLFSQLGVSYAKVENGAVVTRQMTPERFLVESACLAARREVIEELLALPGDLLDQAKELAQKQAEKEEDQDG